ncbi:MAG: hypothetical protein HFJ10_13595 [Lachnospiraceae bacterium]|nr:hypothetical protein [Lachnospiraceae bacterium]
MGSISRLNQTLRTYQPNISTLYKSNTTVSDSNLKPDTVLKDQVSLSEQTNISLDAKTEKLFDLLSKNFPGINFTVASDTEFLNLKEKAASLGYGKHLVISESFLARMGQSEKDFKTCRAILISSVLSLAQNQSDGVFLSKNSAVSWSIGEKEDSEEKESLSQMLQNLQQANAENSNTDFKISSSSNTASDTATLYRKLSQAGNKQLIHSVISEAYQNIASLRMVSCLGEAKDRQTALRAIRSLEKLLMRGRKKLRRLDEEDLLRAKKTKAMKKRQEAKVRELEHELKKKQTKRRREDRNLIAEGEKEAQAIRRIKNYFSSMDNSSLPVELTGTFDAGAAGMTGGEPVSVTCEQISLSEPVAF